MEETQAILWKKSIKVLFHAFQLRRGPSDPARKSEFCLQLKGKCFYCRIITTPEALAKN